MQLKTSTLKVIGLSESRSVTSRVLSGAVGDVGRESCLAYFEFGREG